VTGDKPNEPEQFAQVPQPRKLTPKATASAAGVLITVVAFVIAELVAVFSHREGDTFSEWMWALMGDRGSLRWACIGGFWLGLAVWLLLHFLVETGWSWPQLLVLWAGSILTMAGLWLVGR